MNFSAQDAKLLSLPEQYDKIQYFDSKYWGQTQPNNLERTNLGSPPSQCVDRASLVHVDFGDPSLTVKNWLKVLQGEYPGFWRSDMGVDGSFLQPYRERYYPYPGMYVVNLNLVYGWEPVSGITVEQARARAEAEGKKLAQAEVLAAYALHPSLLGDMDGTHYPYANLAGYKAKRPDPPEDWDYAPCLGEDFMRSGIGIRAGYIGTKLKQWATPVLLDC